MRAIGTRLGRLEHGLGVATESYPALHLRALREAAHRGAIETQAHTEPAGGDGDKAATDVQGEGLTDLPPMSALERLLGRRLS